MKHYQTPENEIMAIDEDQEDLIQDSWTLIEEEQLATKIAEKLEGEFNLLSYAEKRFSEYPPITDYIDGVVKGDAVQVQAYVDACLAVKARYPKP